MRFTSNNRRQPSFPEEEIIIIDSCAPYKLGFSNNETRLMQMGKVKQIMLANSRQATKPGAWTGELMIFSL